MTNQELKKHFIKRSKVKVNINGKWLTGYYINAIIYKLDIQNNFMVSVELVEKDKRVNSILTVSPEQVDI